MSAYTLGEEHFNSWNAVDLIDSPDNVILCLERLNTSIATAESLIYDTVRTYGKLFSFTLHYSTELKAHIPTLSNALHELSAEAQSPNVSLYIKLISSLVHDVELRESISTNTTIIGVLRIMEQLSTEFNEFDVHFLEGDFQRSTATLSQTAQHVDLLVGLGEEQRRLEGEDFGNEVLPRICAVVKDEYRHCKTRMKNRLLSVWKSSVVIESQKLMVHPYYSSSGMDIGMGPVLEGMSMLQIQDDVLQALASALMTHVLEFVLMAQSPIRIAITRLACTDRGDTCHVLQVVSDGEAAYINMDPSCNDSVSKRTENVVAGLAEVLAFVVFHVLSSNEACVRIFGGFLWGPLVDAIIKNCLAANIPDTTSQLMDYKRVAVLIEDFELRMENLGIAPTPGILRKEKISDKVSITLSEYIHDIDIHFALKKQRQLLARARELLVQTDHTSTLVAVGDGNVDINDWDPQFLCFPACSISSTAHYLVLLAYEALDEVARASTKSAAGIYETIRSIFDLFRSVYPAQHADELQSSPQLAMLFYNDCMYIAHQLAFINHQRINPLCMSISMVDMILLIREVGERYYDSCIAQQMDQMRECLVLCGGLADTLEPARHAMVDTALRRAIQQLSHLTHLWRDILPFIPLMVSLARLVDFLLSSLIAEIVGFEAIADQESHTLHSLLTPVCNIPAIIMLSYDNNDNNNPILIRYIPTWSKFLKLVDMLVLPLAKIMENYRAGLLREFQSIELKALLCSLFSDTHARRCALEEITLTKFD
jgi:hypothetical protein